MAGRTAAGPSRQAEAAHHSPHDMQQHDKQNPSHIAQQDIRRQIGRKEFAGLPRVSLSHKHEYGWVYGRLELDEAVHIGNRDTVCDNVEHWTCYAADNRRQEGENQSEGVYPKPSLAPRIVIQLLLPSVIDRADGRDHEQRVHEEAELRAAPYWCQE